MPVSRKSIITVMGNEKAFCIILCEKYVLYVSHFKARIPKVYDSLQKPSKALMVAVGLCGFAVPSIRNSY
jgi:hypothetical protein